MPGRWWVIGSAAVLLHGGETSVADVDVLCEREDGAHVLIAALGGAPLLGAGDALFRSSVFGRADTGALPVEVMAGLTVRGEPVHLVTREWRDRDGLRLPVPTRDELVTLLRLFGRSRDLPRASLLGG